MNPHWERQLINSKTRNINVNDNQSNMYACAIWSTTRSEENN